MEKYYLGDIKEMPSNDDVEFIQKLMQVTIPLNYPVPLITSTTPVPSDESTEPLLMPDSLDEPEIDPLTEKIYNRVLPALHTVNTFLRHHKNLCRESPHSLLDFLRSAVNNPRQTKIPLYQPSNVQELEEDYEVEIGSYNPVQPLFFDHGVSIVPLSIRKTNAVDHHVLQVDILNSNKINHYRFNKQINK